MVSDSKRSYTNSDDEFNAPPGKLDLNSNSGINTPGETKSVDMELKRKKLNNRTPTEKPRNAVEAIQQTKAG